MGKPNKSVLGFMEKYGVESDEIWEVHGSTWVVKHKALERVAVEVGIVWLRPSVQVCDLANKIAVICAFGKLGEREEWSFGEASPANNKNSYPVAMAEKRARDRVILKLLVTHGALYSESEAEEFTQQRQNPHVTRPEDIFPAVEYDENGQPIDSVLWGDTDIKPLAKKDAKEIYKALQAELHAHEEIGPLDKWAATIPNRVAALPADWAETFRGQFKEYKLRLKTREAA